MALATGCRAPRATDEPMLPPITDSASFKRAEHFFLQLLHNSERVCRTAELDPRFDYDHNLAAMVTKAVID
jgi:hypothetical protein